MIKHIVMWKLKDEALGATAAENAKRLKERLEALKGVVDGVIELEVGINTNPSEAAFDVVLYSVFETMDALEAYRTHPEHHSPGLWTDRC